MVAESIHILPTRQKVAALLPLVDRMCRSHCWAKGPKGPRYTPEKLDDFKLAEHVEGRKAYGACPITPGESTTRTALLDLDSHKGETPWSEMLETARNVAFALEQEGYTPILFRSSGGRGVHIYLVWDRPQDAFSVRAMLADVIGALGFENGDGGIGNHEIEVFPKQNEVALDGCGNMWILPWAGESEHLDDRSRMHPDIWQASPDVPQREAPPKAVRPLVTDVSADLDRLRQALAAIPNDGEGLAYDDWRNLIFALHFASDGSDEGLALAHEFSARSAKYDPDFLDARVWCYIQTERGGDVITTDYIIKEAGKHGWEDPTIADDFDVIGAPADEFDALPAVGEAKEAKPPRFVALQESEFLDAPPVSWIIKGILPQAEVGTMFGESGSGKSFMALDMAAVVSLGLEWRGHKVKQGRVVYVAAEGAAGFRNRLKAYRHQHNLTATGVEIIANAPNLLEKADAVDVAKAILARGKADLVVVDTLAQSMAGGNENSGEDMGKLLAHCKGIHRATGAMILLIHHSGKDSTKGARGWSGLRAACDVEMEVVRADDDRVLTVTKQKDGQDGAEFGFKLETVLIDMDEDGDEVTSCVVTHCAAASGVRDRRRAKPLGDVERAVLQALDGCLELGGDAIAEAKVALAAKDMLDPPEAGKRDTRLQRVGRAIESLIAGGRVHREDGGLAPGGAR